MIFQLPFSPDLNLIETVEYHEGLESRPLSCEHEVCMAEVCCLLGMGCSGA